MTQQAIQPSTSPQRLREALTALDGMTVKQLQRSWEEVFDEPSLSRNRAYLVKRLRYKLQEQAQGGLSQAARQRILALAQTSTALQRVPRGALRLLSTEGAQEVTVAAPPVMSAQGLAQPITPTAEAALTPAPEAPAEGPGQAPARVLVRDPRLPAPGLVLRRIYQGRVYEVKVLEDGFLYEEAHHKSLSGIARKITGTPWNGFAFFKLDQDQGSTQGG